jgi:peptidoglycan/xylan/chitin deacetylase (PgdA/CDA1 family)
MSGWGPDRRAASVSFTFDHLGEAAELELGIWPEDSPVGRHPSVVEVLPNLLSILDRQGVRATFFVEAWNAAHYPDALADIVGGGHEIACHSFRHENWEKLSVAEIGVLVDKSLEAYADLGITVSGVRPPGGLPPEGYADVLRARDLDYVSLADDAPGVEAGLAHVPFQWRAVDGGYYLAHFSHLRQDPPGEEAVSVEEMLEVYEGLVDEVVSEGSHLSFIYHVPWQDSDERLAGLEELARRLAQDDRLWLAPSSEIARWMLEQPGSYKYEPRDPAKRAWDPKSLSASAKEETSIVTEGRDG